MSKVDYFLRQFRALKELYELAGYSKEDIVKASILEISDGDSYDVKVSKNRAHTFSQIRQWLIADLKAELEAMATAEPEEEVDIQSLCGFFEKNQGITSYLFRSILMMMANPIYSDLGYIENVLATKAMEDRLVLRDTEEVVQLFKAIMVNKVKASCESSAFTWNYRIFLDWFPKFWDIYPEVKQAVAEEFVAKEKRGDLSLRCWEHQKLYDLYNK